MTDVLRVSAEKAKKVACTHLSINRRSENLWLPGVLFFAGSRSKKIGGLLMRKILREQGMMLPIAYFLVCKSGFNGIWQYFIIYALQHEF